MVFCPTSACLGCAGYDTQCHSPVQCMVDEETTRAITAAHCRINPHTSPGPNHSICTPEECWRGVPLAGVTAPSTAAAGSPPRKRIAAVAAAAACGSCAGVLTQKPSPGFCVDAFEAVLHMRGQDASMHKERAANLRASQHPRQAHISGELVRCVATPQDMRQAVSHTVSQSCPPCCCSFTKTVSCTPVATPQMNVCASVRCKSALPCLHHASCC
jgi:hypothetical protein